MRAIISLFILACSALAGPYDMGTPVTPYRAAYDEAIASRQRFAVFVGVPCRKIAGVSTVSVEHFAGYPAKAIVVFGYDAKLGYHVLLGVVDPATTDAEILSGGGRKEVVPVAVDPFRFTLPSARRGSGC